MGPVTPTVDETPRLWGWQRVSDPAVRSATGTTLVVVDLVRVLGLVLELPVQAAGARPAGGLVALGLTGLVVGGHFVLWSRISGRLGAYAALLAVEGGVAVAVHAVDGTGVPLGNQLFGVAMVSAALLGVHAAALGATLGVGLALLLAVTAPGLSFELQASLPVPFVLVCLLVAAVRHVLVQQYRLRVALRSAVAQVATVRERSRLARDLHDSLAKTVAGIGLSAGGLRMRLPGSEPAVARLVDDIETSSSQALNDLRGVISGLRFSADGPFAEVLESLVSRWGERHAIDAEVEWHAGSRPETSRLDESAREAGLAIVAECLTNVERHAAAERVRVAVSIGVGVGVGVGVGSGSGSGGDELVVEVGDDGTGFEVPRHLTDLAADGHYGVVGMSERARSARGRLSVRSGAAGTSTTVGLPLGRRVPVGSGRSGR